MQSGRVCASPRAVPSGLEQAKCARALRAALHDGAEAFCGWRGGTERLAARFEHHAVAGSPDARVDATGG
jgi:hypothetical protein